MLTTTVDQECLQEMLADGTLKYTIITTVVDKGELPYLQFFVYSVVDPADPKDDTFERVGNPYDLENVNNNRTAAIIAGETTYLSSELRREYLTLDVAVQAKDAVKSRVNDGVKAWYTYVTEFEGSSSDVYPTVDPSYEQALINAYTAAKVARVAAEGTVTDADTDVTVAEAEASAAAQIVAIYQSEKSFCDSARLVAWTNYYGAVGSFSSSIVTQNNRYSGFITSITAAYDAHSGSTYPVAPTDPDWSTVFTALNSYSSDPANFQTGPLALFQSSENYGATLDAEFAAFCAAAAANYTAALGQKQAKDQAVATSVTAKEEAEASLVVAQEAEDTALAAVVAVCPTFDPLSV
ncbi:MAG: hypothetical protein DRP01_00355 [Archaeoglobales archaeon]|nr:MAG: hypothetical protein DRP01_00355 [Archaeoglobales archaeon]